MSGRRLEYIFFWSIQNYSYSWHRNGEELISPEFSIEGLQGTAWNLRLYPRGVFQTCSDCISLFLCRSKSDDGPSGNVHIKFEMALLAADGSLLFSKERDGALKRSDIRGWFAFLKREEIFGRKADYLPQDTLSVRCKIWKGEGNVVRGIRQCYARTRIGVENISFTHVVENFSSLEPNQMHTVEVPSDQEEEQFASSSLYFTDDPWRKGEVFVEITPFLSSHVLSERKVSLLDGPGNAIAIGEDDNRLDAERKDISDLPLSLKRKEILDKESEYLPDDKLSLLCECVFTTGLEFEKIEEIRRDNNTIEKLVLP